MNQTISNSREYVIDAEYYENRIRHDFAMAGMECSDGVVSGLIELIALNQSLLCRDIYSDIMRVILPPMKLSGISITIESRE